MKTTLSFASLAVFLLAVSACGSPFVKGWGGTAATPAPVDAKAQCTTLKDHQWKNGQCVKNADLPLTDLTDKASCESRSGAVWTGTQCLAVNLVTAAQCAGTPGYEWAQKDGKDQCLQLAEAECLKDAQKVYIAGACKTRPSFQVSGATTQTIAAGAAMAPLAITTGAEVAIIEKTCTGFFKMVDSKLTSVQTEAQTPAETCTADLVGSLAGVPSAPVSVSVTVVQGFLGYCLAFAKDPTTSLDPAQRDLYHTVVVLKDTIAKKNDCAEAAKALAALPEGTIDFSNLDLVDLRPLTSLTNVQSLDLKDNHIVDISPLAVLPNLELVYMDGNPLSDKSDGGDKRNDKNCPSDAKVASIGVRQYCAK